MARDVYRFLLRMPTHLRERLTDATAESGRSLNAEIVNLLEQSLAENPGVFRRLGLRISDAWRATGERIPRERRSMTPKNPRRATRAAGLSSGGRGGCRADGGYCRWRTHVRPDVADGLADTR